MASFLTSINDALENVLANSAAFLTWSGAADAAEAKADYIFSFDEAPDPVPEKWCNVRDMEPWSFSRDSDDSDGGAAAMTEEATIEIVLFETVDDWDETNARAFMDAMGSIILDVLNNAATYNLRTASITKKPYTDVIRLRATDGKVKGYQYGWRYAHKI
jgi:hypothetical protein